MRRDHPLCLGRVPGKIQLHELRRVRSSQESIDHDDGLCNSRYIETRERLLYSCLAYFLRHGVAHLSLRPLAAAVGTSARMLLHYFGSKERLITEVMAQVHLQLQATFRDLLERPGNKADQHFLLEFWGALTTKANRASLRLLFEVQMLALQNPKRYRRYLTRTSGSWRKLIEQALPRRGNAAASATLHNAVVDGLLLELLATGDLRRTSQALRLFVDRCAPGATAERKARS